MVRDPRAVFDQLFGVGATPAGARGAPRARIAASSTGSAPRSTRLKQGARRRRSRAARATTSTTCARSSGAFSSVEAHNSERRAARAARRADRRARLVRGARQADVRPAGAGVRRRTSRACSRSSSDATRRTASIRRAASRRRSTPRRITTSARIASREFAKINRYHVSMMPYFLEKLKNTPDGDGNLLDNTLIIYGSPMGNSNVHNHKRCPLFLAGHAGGAAQGRPAPRRPPTARRWRT